MPRLKLLTHQLRWEAAALVVWSLPVRARRGQQSGWVGEKGPQSSLVVGHGTVLVTVSVAVGGARGALGVVAPGQIHVRRVRHHLLRTIDFMERRAGLVLGVVVEAIWLPQGRLGCVAASWRWLVLHRGVAQQLPTRWTVVGSEGVLRVAVLRTGSVGIV